MTVSLIAPHPMVAWPQHRPAVLGQQRTAQLYSRLALADGSCGSCAGRSIAIKYKLAKSLSRRANRYPHL